VLGMVIGIIERLDNATIFNYRAIVNSHTFQFTKARTKPSVCCVFDSRSWVTALIAVDSTPSGFNGFCARWLETLSHLPWLQVCLHLLNSSKLQFGSRYVASGRTPQKTPLPKVLLLLRVNIRCQSKRAYRAIAQQRPSLLVP
jgi:hypothetical protein